MAAFVRVVLVLLICWTQRCSTQNNPLSRISLSKEKIMLTPNTANTGTVISVTCQPPASGVKTVFSLQIRRLAFTDPPNTESNILVAAVVGENNGEAELKVSMQNATATGSTTSQSITLRMNQAKCSDQGTYICSASYSKLDSSGATPQATSSKDLTAEVGPGQVTMTASSMPFGKSTWAVNDTLTLTCEAPVGTVNNTSNPPNPQITWIWQQYKTPVSSWSTYYPDSDINTGNYINDNSVSCNNYKRQTSTLQRHLTVDDTGRMYRCFVRRGRQDFEHFADNYTVGTVTPDGATPKPDNPDETSSASVGAIVGGVIGSLIVIAVIIIIVYFLVIRPRRQKKDDDLTYHGPQNEDDKEAVPPYTTSADPSVVYSLPVKRGKDKTKDKAQTPEENEGVTNKGMDTSDKKHGLDDTTKLPPDDNDDRRHGRRSHKDKKHPPAPYEPQPAVHDDYDPHYGRGDRDDRRDRRHRDDDRHGDDRRGNEDNRRGPSGDRRRPRDADNYDEKPARYDDYGQGRRNRGYEKDSRPRGHHSSSEDGGTDHSFGNTSHHSVGDGDPTIGTSI